VSTYFLRESQITLVYDQATGTLQADKSQKAKTIIRKVRAASFRRRGTAATISPATGRYGADVQSWMFVQRP
jgi:hypothetical protein